MDTCDCHVHLYDVRDPRWAATGAALRQADLSEYERLRKRLRTRRTVVVQPLLYGQDNSFMLEMARALGSANARCIAIAPSSITDDDLDSLREKGTVGLRLFVGSALPGTSKLDDVLAEVSTLDARLHARGMHFQINTNGAFLESNAGVFESFISTLVFDHLGHVLPRGQEYVGLPELIRLSERAGSWVKVSGLYLDSLDQASRCDDMKSAVSRLAEAIPDRLIWGTNWPHPTIRPTEHLPDDFTLLERPEQWLGDRRELVLDVNARHLYGFAS